MLLPQPGPEAPDWALALLPVSSGVMRRLPSSGNEQTAKRELNSPISKRCESEFRLPRMPHVT